MLSVVKGIVCAISKYKNKTLLFSECQKRQHHRVESYDSREDPETGKLSEHFTLLSVCTRSFEWQI